MAQGRISSSHDASDITSAELAAALSAIDMQMQTDLEPVCRARRKSMQKIAEWTARVCADASRYNKKMLQRHKRALAAHVREVDAIRRAASRRRIAARIAHHAAARADASRSGEAADDPLHRGPRQRGPAVAPSQEGNDARVEAFRTALGTGEMRLRCCAVCHHAMFADELTNGSLMTVKKFLSMKAIAKGNVLEEPRLAGKGAARLREHDFTGATLHIPTHEFGRAWAAKAFGEGNIPLYLTATVLGRVGGHDPADPHFGEFTIQVHRGAHSRGGTRAMGVRQAGCQPVAVCVCRSSLLQMRSPRRRLCQRRRVRRQSSREWRMRRSSSSSKRMWRWVHHKMRMRVPLQRWQSCDDCGWLSSARVLRAWAKIRWDRSTRSSLAWRRVFEGGSSTQGTSCTLRSGS